MPAPHKPTARFDAFAIAAPGLAPLVAAELVAIGITPRETSDAGVAFDADASSLFAANLWSRIASRVIVRLASFEARDFATLEKQSARVPWGNVIRPDGTVSLRVTCRKSRLYHSDAVAERVARAIVKQFPRVSIVDVLDDERIDDGSPIDPHVQRIIVRFERDRCTISADSSGELLHRRGWRQAVAKAPLRETIAAAMLAACEWNGERALVDPFCGSGTIGIEAALRARAIAPGIAREFAMERWPGWDDAIGTQARLAARAGERGAAGVPIVMRDRDAGAIRAARENAERAGVLADLVIEEGALSDTALDAIADEGLLLTNPPYGVRVSEGNDLRPLYSRLGDVLRAGGRGWQLAMLVPDRALAGQLRIPLDTVLRTTNGGLPVSVERTRSVARSR